MNKEETLKKKLARCSFCHFGYFEQDGHTCKTEEEIKKTYFQYHNFCIDCHNTFLLHTEHENFVCEKCTERRENLANKLRNRPRVK